MKREKNKMALKLKMFQAEEIGEIEKEVEEWINAQDSAVMTIRYTEMSTASES